MAHGDAKQMSGITRGVNQTAYEGHGTRRAPDSISGGGQSLGFDRWLRHFLAVASIAVLCFLAARLCQLAANRVFSYAFLCALLIHYISAPRKRDFLYAGLLGAATMLAYRLSGGRFYPVLDLKLFDLTAFAGIGSIILLSWQYFTATDSGLAARRAKTLRSAVTMPVCCLLSYVFFAIFFSSGKIEISWDSLLYRFDLRLGAPWSFLAGQVFEQHTLLRDTASLVYQSVLFGLAVLYVALRKQIETLPVNTIAAFLVGTVAGVMCYFIIPGAGPFYVFPG
ncbi:MAG: phosphatase PAP2 family protein, partial [Acidobacteria bacterium]|nr:phosphatase PAP2 family protein [Acidobacteriota bacterium]